MASDPFPDTKRRIWRMKYKPDPSGKWKAVTLGKDPRLGDARPPKKPPQFVLDRAAEFTEIEYRAKHGLGRGPTRARGIDAYFADYIAKQAIRKNSMKQLRRHAVSFLEFCRRSGISTIQGVTKTACRNYLAERIKRVGASTLRTERGYLIGIFSRAEEDDELIPSNPWRGVKIPKKIVDPVPTFWSHEDVARIAAACNRQIYRDLVMVLAETGLRISTALCMEWKWIDWRSGTISIPEGDEIKTAYSHFMYPAARDVLERRQVTAEDPVLVFPNPLRPGKRIHYDTARDAVARAIAASKVRAGTPHDLRHSYGRAMALGGVPVTVIQSQMGHTSITMTQKYMQADSTQAAQFVGRFEASRELKAGS